MFSKEPNTIGLAINGVEKWRLLEDGTFYNIATGNSVAQKVVGSGHASGNTITKTLQTSGGYFSTFADVMEYVSSNMFDNVDLTISAGAGTFSIDPTSTWNLGRVNGLSKLTFAGAGSSSTIFSSERSDGTDLFNIRDDIYFSGIKFLNAGSGDGLFAEVSGAKLQISSCSFVDWRKIAITAGHIRADSCEFTTPENGANGGTYLHFLSMSTGIVQGCTFTGDDDDNITAMSLEHMSHCLFQGNTVADCYRGVDPSSGSTVISLDNTFNNNSENYSIDVNTILGDGTCITTGGPLTLDS